MHLCCAAHRAIAHAQGSQGIGRRDRGQSAQPQRPAESGGEVRDWRLAIREQAKRLNWLTEAQAALGWGLILILAALLGAVYLGQTSRIAGVGRRVQVMQNELERLKRENAALEREVAEAQSLERLRQEAIRLGFVQSQPADIEYVIVPNYPADERPAANEALVTPTPVATPAPPPETIREALWLSLKTRMGDLMQGEASE